MVEAIRATVAGMADAVLVVHVSAGFLALFVAPGAMATRKGGRWHKRWGRLFVWAMSAVAASAVFLAAAGGDPFLFLVALFSFYLAFSGYRVLRRKRPQLEERPPTLDLTVAVGTLLASVALALYGVAQVLSGTTFGAVAVAFGVAGCVFSGGDLKQMVRPPKDERWWWFAHMGNMLGAYIATVSAFSAVNLDFLPPLVRWLWPSVVGGAAIALWTAHYRRKFAHKRAVPRGTSAQKGAA